MNTKIYGYLLSLVVCLALFSVAQVVAQTSELKTQSTQDGFSGEYVSGTTKLFVEYNALAIDSYISRIKNSENETIVETIRNKDVVTVMMAGVTLTFNIGKTSIKTPGPSEADRAKLEKFSLSEESALIRDLIAELIKKSQTLTMGRLKGFVIAAMVLGDGPGVPEGLQSNANCQSPKLVQMYASFKQSEKPIVNKSPNGNLNGAADLEACRGCCGPGCWGCSGIWTVECLAHDLCVETLGYFHSQCMALLALAIASMA